MTDKTKIEWTDATWNPVRGCTIVSDGCRNCYAMHVAHRFNGAGQPYEGLTRMTSKGPRWTGRIRLVHEMLFQPLRWKRPRRIFVNSMSDLFHESVPTEFIDQVFAVMALAPQHVFQILTKRPERMREYLSDSGLMVRLGYVASSFLKSGERARLREPDWPIPNVWLGVSVEDQETANERIPLLLRTPAAVRWLSMEPLLGPIKFNPYTLTERPCFVCKVEDDCKYERGALSHPINCGWRQDNEGHDLDRHVCSGVDWVVAGGESGKDARPMHPDWARSLRDQCQAAGVPFFFKQWGEWWPNCYTKPNGERDESTMWMDRIGKKNAGRLLDGREWNEYPGETA